MDEVPDEYDPPHANAAASEEPEPGAGPAVPPRAPLRPWLEIVLWSLAAFLLSFFNQYGRRVLPLPAPETLGESLVAMLYLGLLLLALMKAARAAADLPHRPGFLLLCGLLLAVPLGVLWAVGRLGVFPTPALALTANNLFLVPALCLAGAALGRIIRHPNTLLAASGFVVFFDIVVVTMGTVALLLRNSPHVIAAASVGGAPTPPAGVRIPLGPPPLTGVTIGPADVLFLAFFLWAVQDLRLSLRATLAWTYGLLFLALAWVQFTGMPLPALAPMGAGILIANARHAAFTREEKYALIYGGLFAGVLAILMVAAARGLLGG